MVIFPVKAERRAWYSRTAHAKYLSKHHSRYGGYVNSVDWNGGMERWIGLLEWSTGLDYWSATPTNAQSSMATNLIFKVPLNCVGVRWGI